MTVKSHKSKIINVKIYVNDTTDAVSSATVSNSQYILHDSTSILRAGCSVNHELQHGNDVGWTAVLTKLKGH